MRVLVIGGFAVDTPFAHVINTLKMGQAFARLGHSVTVLCRGGPDGVLQRDRLADLYGITEELRWLQLPQRWVPHSYNHPRRFGLFALPIALALRPHLVYARSFEVADLTTSCRLPTVCEDHSEVGMTTPAFLSGVRATRRGSYLGWVTISNRLVDYYASLGVPRRKLLVLPDAVDLPLFRRPWVLPPSPYSGPGPQVVYIGHLYDYKGIPTLLEAAAILPYATFHLVGGWPNDVARHQLTTDDLGLRNVVLHGMIPQAQLPPYLWHADVLVLPPSAQHRSAAWTSPLKLAEYLSSGSPVVATDIPGLRDWVNDEVVQFVSPDDAVALADGIRRLLSDPGASRRLAMGGLRVAETLSYERRAAAILEWVRDDSRALNA